MAREIELHVNRHPLPVRYRTGDVRRLIETKGGTIAEVRFRTLFDGRVRKEILRRLFEVKAPLPRSRSLVLVQASDVERSR